MIQLMFLLPVFFLHMFWSSFNKWLVPPLCALSFEHAFILGAYAVCYCAHFTTSWLHCQVQFVALSCNLPACCACALVRIEETNHCTVLEPHVFHFCNTYLLKKSLNWKPIVQLKPEYCNLVSVSWAAVVFPYSCDFIYI